MTGYGMAEKHTENYSVKVELRSLNGKFLDLSLRVPRFLMPKEIELNIEIDEKGNVKVTPKGTVGKECLDILKFLDKLEGVEVQETVANDDMNKTTLQKPRLLVYRIVPYNVHASSGPTPAGRKPPGYEQLKLQAVKVKL